MTSFEVVRMYGANKLVFLMIKAHKIATSDSELCKFKEKTKRIEDKLKNILRYLKETEKIEAPVTFKDLFLALKLLRISTKFWNNHFMKLWIETELKRREYYNYPENLSSSQWNNIFTEASDLFEQSRKDNLIEEFKI